MAIIFLEHLKEYCERYNLSHYSSKDNNNEMIMVSVPGDFKTDTSMKFSSVDTEGLLPVTLQSCHIYENRNGSYISKSTMNKALPTFSNKPILGHIIQKDDGTYDFDSHNMEMVDDPWNEGEQRVHYIEQPIGIVPESCNARLEYDEEKEKTYVVIDGWIFEDYGNGAAEIIKEKGGTKVSVELGVKEFSYNSKKKRLEIKDFVFMGVTALGEHVGEGMLGSNMKLSDFSYPEDTKDSFEQSEITLEELNRKIQRIEELYLEKGGRSVKLEELLEKYNKTMDDINFDIEGLTDDKLEQLFKDNFEEEDAGEADNEDSTSETESENVSDETTVEEPVSEPESVVEPINEESEEASATKEETEETVIEQDDCKKKKYSIELGEKSYTFESSLDEVIYALETLVNNTYSESDNAYYGVKVYDKYVVMVDYWTGKAYKQSYKVRSDVYSLTGDRVEVYSRYLTREEENALDEMRSKFSEMESKLGEYQEKEENILKDNLIKSNDYSLIKESDEFKSIVENLKDYSLDELTKKCDELLLKHAKRNTFSFSENKTEKRRNIRTGAQKEETYSPYGTLFQEYK